MQNSGNLLPYHWAGKWIVVAFIFVFGLSGQLFAKPAGCPCGPCTCSPCHCSGGGDSTGKSDKHHHDKDHTGGVGFGANVDLGGVGQRHREADPFAAGGKSSNTPHTQEKPVTTAKKHERGTTSTLFSDVQLTGSRAKALAEDDTTPAHN